MNNENTSPILVGTCGWSYPKEWKEVFYPHFLPTTEFLNYYSKVFSTVEIDSSFYKTPSLHSVKNWLEQSPTSFLFSVKLPQEVTHKKKLDWDTSLSALENHFETFTPMEQKSRLLGHLIQLPPSFDMTRNWNRLENFLNKWKDWQESRGKEILGRNFASDAWQPIIEFRHRSWMKERTFALLRAYHVTYCAVIEPILPPELIITTPHLFYMRFHGYGNKPFWKYNFSEEELTKWALELKNSQNENGKTKHVAYFNNHFSGYAVKNALDFLPKVNQSLHQDIKQINKEFLQKIEKRKKITPKLKKQMEQHKSLDKWFKN